MRHRVPLLPSVIAVAAAVATSAAPAQIALDRFGFQVTGQNGTAGEFCWVVDCTPRPLAVLAGETLTLRVNAPFQQLFAIGGALGTAPCVQIPGIANALLLDPASLVILASGLVSQPSPILSCWGGFELVQLPLPAGQPPGFSFVSQAIADLAPTTGLALSVAVRNTVQ
jgi:hypothetical protein